LIDGASVVVKSDAAARQIQGEKPPDPDPDPDPDPEPEPGSGPAPGHDADADPDPPPPPPKGATRFFAVTSLDPRRVSRDADLIAAEIVTHLVGLVGANVEVKLEIRAEVPNGVPDNVVRTVTENAATLKFEQHGFEDE
jgi:hypothetical protein